MGTYVTARGDWRHASPRVRRSCKQQAHRRFRRAARQHLHPWSLSLEYLPYPPWWLLSPFDSAEYDGAEPWTHYDIDDHPDWISLPDLD